MGYTTARQISETAIGDLLPALPYARASSEDQSTAIQAEQLKAVGCSVALTEKASGTKREGRDKLDLTLQMLMAHPGSTLVVCHLRPPRSEHPSGSGAS